MKYVAGVDAHKRTHAVVFLDAVGKVVQSFTILTNQEGYEQALSVARSLDGEVTWGLESTGCYAAAFGRALVDSGAVVYEVPGSYTKRHRQRSSRPGKSDSLDAQAIAEAVLRESERLPRFAGAVECDALRLRYDQRDRLVRQRTEAVNRLRSAALRLDRGNVPADVLSASGIRAVEDIIARAEAVPDLVIQALVDDLRFAVEDIGRINARIKTLEALLRPIVRRLAPELLELCGVSTIVASGLIGHAGDLRNCRNADAFAMRAGTAPVNCSSGMHTAVRLNRGGNRQLNRLLHVIALVQLSHGDQAGRRYYERKRSEGKTSRAALRALKRKLTVVVYYRLLAAAARFAVSSDLRNAA
jgi:transposase